LLNQQYHNIQNELSLVTEEKLRLEHEYKQRFEIDDRQIKDLRTESLSNEEIINELYK